MSQEFSSLCDLVLARGVQHSQLLTQIKTAVLLEYSKNYPQKTANLEVSIDEQNGKVRIFKLGKDITPSEFTLKAEEVARKVLVDLLWQNEQVKTVSEPSISYHENKLGGFLAQAIFWGYNFSYLFLLFIFLLGFINYQTDLTLWERIKELGVFKGLLSLLFGLIPLGTLLYVVKTKLYRNSTQLLKTFFMLEVPLVLATFIPFSILNNPIPPVVVYTFLFLITPVLLLLSKRIHEFTSTKIRIAIMLVQQYSLQFWVYLIGLFIYFIPLILGGYAKLVFGHLIESVMPHPYYGDFYRSMIMPPSSAPISILSLFLMGTLGIVGFVCLAGLIILPFLLIYDLVKLLNRNRLVLTEKIGSDQTLIYHLGVVAVWIVSMVIMSYQPYNNRLVTSLLNFKNETSFADKKLIAKEISRHESTLKQTIKDMVNARNRYPLTTDDKGIEAAYRNVFYFSSDSQIPEYIQKSFLSFAAPFVYRGEKSFSSDANRAYEDFFGHTIYEETYKPVENKDVRVVARTINATSSSDGLLATISIEEEFASKTSQQEEVIYEFALPNEAVITDLKLGPNLEFDGLVAPRGAAQKTYEQQLVQRRDPALLEQTGPRQYRLRVFPIPGKNDKTTLNGRNQKVKYTYVIALSEKGYALPVFSKKMNVDDSLQTRNQYILDGKTITLRKDEQFINNYGKGIDLCRQQSTAPIMARVGSASLRLVPYGSISQLKSDLPCSLVTGSGLVPTSGSNIALLYDVSYQNKDDSTLIDIENILKDNKNFFSDNQVDWYEFNSQLSEGIRLTADTKETMFDIPYFGKSEPLKVLQTLPKQYDFVIIVTANTDTFSQYSADYQQLSAPIAFIHTQNLPAYRNEFTSSLLQQGGGVYDSVRAALIHFALKQRLQAVSSEQFISFLSYWAVSSDEQPNSTQTQQKVDAAVNGIVWQTPSYDPNQVNTSLANAFYLRYKLSQYQGNLVNNVNLLDKANTFATAAHIVSPFSSMLALVNSQQMDDLRRNLQDSRRYVEGNTPQITSNSNMRSITINEESSFGATNFGKISGGILNPMMDDAMSLKMPSAAEGGVTAIGLGGQRSSSSSFFGGGSLIVLFIIINAILVGGAVVIMGMKKVLRRRK